MVPAPAADTAQPLQDPVQGSVHSAQSDADENELSSDGSDSHSADGNRQGDFLEMYESKWTEHDYIFSAQHAAIHLDKAVKQIKTPDTLTHLKASVIQIKTLNQRFDDTNSAIDGLRNDIALRERNLFLDKSKYVTLLKDQEGLNKRLITVEANQAAMSSKLDAIATSIELTPHLSSHSR